MFRFLLDLLLPQSPAIAQLERMSPEEFRATVPSLSAQPREWVLPLFPYEHPLVKRAVWEVKYRGNTRVAALLGALLAEELAGWLAELAETVSLRAPLLVPIPLAPGRLRTRGWNQCELLARETARSLGEMVELRMDILIKTKETESQTKAESREKRMENLHGCFSVMNSREVAGCDMVLLDDVTTTGATLLEARRTLLACGAHSVRAISVAH
jgi:ComF family protein